MDIYDFEGLAILIGAIVIGSSLGVAAGILINPIFGVFVTVVYVGVKIG